MITKTCKSCNLPKNLEEFCKDKRETDGHTNQCKLCKNLKMQEWKEKNQEKVFLYHRQYKKENQSKLLQYKQEWDKRHPLKKITKVCQVCSKRYDISPYAYKNTTCSKKCDNRQKGLTVLCQCVNCGQDTIKNRRAFLKNKNNFCSPYCSGFYNATHKTNGIKRSKLEKYIEDELKKKYPTLNILLNDHETINSELDFFIPSLNLAIEINGVFHYEPIFGEEKLNKIKNNDQRKFQACLEKQIELCVINTSNASNKKNIKECLNAIFYLIESKIKKDSVQ